METINALFRHGIDKAAWSGDANSPYNQISLITLGSGNNGNDLACLRI